MAKQRSYDVNDNRVKIHSVRLEWLGAPDPSDMATIGLLTEGSSSALRPEKRLIQAILEDAIEKIAKARRKGVLAIEEMEWIESDDRRWIFSFQNCCDFIGIDASCVRSAVARMK